MSLLKKYRKIKYLGKGSYGAAILVQLRSNPNQKFVIKEIIIGHLKPQEQSNAKNVISLSIYSPCKLIFVADSFFMSHFIFMFHFELLFHVSFFHFFFMFHLTLFFSRKRRFYTNCLIPISQCILKVLLRIPSYIL